MGTHPIFESDFDCLTEMSDWGGFSEAELSRLRSGGDVKPKVAQTGAAAAPAQNGKKGLGGAVRKTSKVKKKEKLAEAAMLPTSKSPVVSVKETSESTTIEETVNEKNTVVIEDEVEIEEKKKIEVSDLNRLQREMEEKNKRRRAALSQEVFDRQRAAAAETAMLKTIEVELAKLDQLLTVDVAKLRDQIDTASFEYNEARHRFNLAEKEYIASKFDLQSKTEAKDTLTEQLVQLIQLNEERKLGKLEELTFKLSMDPEVVAKRETEAAEKLKLEELELQKKKDEERQARLDEETRLKIERENAEKEEKTALENEEEAKAENNDQIDSSELKGNHE